jgi:diguanylate cyclase (GGDEF)-like protein
VDDGVSEQPGRSSARRGLGRGLGAILPARGLAYPGSASAPAPSRPPSLHERLDDALDEARRDGVPVAVVVFGLDGFRHLNAQFGHEVGDAVLQGLADRLSANRRGGDVAGRLRADEFLVLCPRVTHEAEGRVLARLEREVEEPLAVSGNEHRLRATFGIVVVGPKDDSSGRALLRRADLAMHRAKDERRRWARFDPAGPGAVASPVRPTADPVPPTARPVPPPAHPVPPPAHPDPPAAVRYRPVADLRSRLATAARAHVVEMPLALPRLFTDLQGWQEATELPEGFRVWADLDACVPAASASAGSVAALLDALLAHPAARPDALGVVLGSTTVEALAGDTALLAAVRRMAGAGVAVGVDATDLVSAARTELLSVPLSALWLPADLVAVPAARAAGDSARQAERSTDRARRMTVARSLAVLAMELGLEVLATGADDEDVARALRTAGCTSATGTLYGGPLSAERFAGLLWASAGAYHAPMWNAAPSGRLGRPADAEGGSSSAAWPRSTAPT